MARHDRTSIEKDEPGDPVTDPLSGDPPEQTAEAEHGSSTDPDIRSKNRRLERGLWAGFGVLFAIVLLSVYLPVEPIVFVFPLWSVLALAAMVASVVVAAVAGVGYGWPEGYR
ncbi:MAG: hypothetical protein V5A36_08935 [Natronomonas sp.]